MAKTSTVSTIPPELFSLGREVFFEDARAVCEMLNHALTSHPLPHVSLACGDDNWGGTGSLQTLRIRFPAGTGWTERLRFKIVVPPECVTLTVGARCFMSASQNGQVRFTIGAAAAVTVTTFQNVTNGSYHRSTVAVSSSGTGAIDCVVEINHTLGSATDCFLRTLVVEEAPLVAATLFDPQDN